MSTVELLRSRLASLDPIHVDVVDDSARHVGHAGAAGGGGHFSVTVVSERFCGMSRPERHRAVYDRLRDLIPGTVHALQIRALTPDELSPPQ